MKIHTKFFGSVEIEEINIISFEEGIPGFEELSKFVIIDVEDNKNLKCLQSLENPDVCLLIMIPWQYFENYQIELTDKEIKELEIEKETDTLVYNIVTVRNDKVTANLLAPIIINVIKNKGRQIILQNKEYEIRQEIACSFYQEK